MINPKVTILRQLPGCAHYVGKFKAEGTITIFNGAIAFAANDTQIASFHHVVAKSNHEILMADMNKSERHKMMGVKCCMKISMANGREYIYSLWPFRKELDDIVGLVNEQIPRNRPYSLEPNAYLSPFCKACGTAYEPDAMFCEKCGAKRTE